MAGLGPETNKKRDGTFEYYISEPVVEKRRKGHGPFRNGIYRNQTIID